MYRRTVPGQIKMDIPFNVPLSSDSKWVKLADQMPWDLVEQEYEKHFEGAEGQIAKPSRLAFGALYIQISEGFTDEQTTENIRDNPAMQYFCGFESYNPVPPFDQSMMTRFRKRIPSDTIMRITEMAFTGDALMEMEPAAEIPAADDKSETEEPPAEGDSNQPEVSNRGALIVDATCFPQDIHYPTDVGLLNWCRELLELIIDVLFGLVSDKFKVKPRTYRIEARKVYLSFAKARKHTVSKIRKQIRAQLQYVARDLRIIEDFISKGADLSVLPDQIQEKYQTIKTVYRQQKEMYDNGTHKCEDRIVSISQPHIRPIVRGKEHKPTEFGAKVAIALISGYSFITDISWDNISEATLLPEAAEQYKRMFGFYPRVIIGDSAYINRVNQAWCKGKNIRLSGPRRGRKSEDFKREEAKLLAEEGCMRNAVEGKFGLLKRKYGLEIIMTKLPDTSMSVIAMGFFVSNMERRLRRLSRAQSKLAA